MRSKRTLVASVAGVALLVVTGAASAADIRGTISTTLVITEDSQLVGDVTCTVTGAPCISFGASGISLRLNGFTLTGLADPVTGCSGTNNTLLESGIDISNQRGAVIQGPGLVQRFRSDGIRINASERVLMTLVTSSTNCASGVRVIAGSDNEIVNNTLIRNGNTTIPCGGIWLTSATRGNRLRANRVTGNGYAAQGNNFGIGLVTAGANDNIIVGNTIFGNANGIVVFAGAEGNVFASNVVMGNPPVQISVNNPTTTGVDIRNLATPGLNIFESNVCLTQVSAECAAAANLLPPR